MAIWEAVDMGATVSPMQQGRACQSPPPYTGLDPDTLRGPLHQEDPSFLLQK